MMFSAVPIVYKFYYSPISHLKTIYNIDSIDYTNHEELAQMEKDMDECYADSPDDGSM